VLNILFIEVRIEVSFDLLQYKSFSVNWSSRSWSMVIFEGSYSTFFVYMYIFSSNFLKMK
jgi:hypothetical protein